MSGGQSYAVATESLGSPYRKSFGSIRSSAVILVILGARDIASSPAGAACLLPQSQGACTVPQRVAFWAVWW